MRHVEQNLREQGERILLDSPVWHGAVRQDARVRPGARLLRARPRAGLANRLVQHRTAPGGPSVYGDDTLLSPSTETARSAVKTGMM